MQAGDLVSLVVGPRDGNHGCDTTEVDLDIVPMGDAARRWHLAPDVSGDLLAGNPHPTREQIDSAMTGNICRCATYQRIRRAVERAAQEAAR